MRWGFVLCPARCHLCPDGLGMDPSTGAPPGSDPHPSPPAPTEERHSLLPAVEAASTLYRELLMAWCRERGDDPLAY